MSEGRNNKGWKSFVSELRVVVKYTQSIYGGHNYNSMLEQKSKAVVGEKRLFAEVMMHMAKEPKPLTSKRSPSGNELKESTKETAKESEPSA